MGQEKFLTQSYLDALNDFEYSLKNKKAAHWDYVFITASNEKQAEAYRIQISNRIEKHQLPGATEFIVVPDLDGKRIGSGGATFNILKVLSDKIGTDNVDKKKILVIHSGGDSKRVPQYSACGKLFSPVPRCIAGGRRTTIFDELLIAVSGVVARCSNGMLIVPSDTVMLFNPLQVDLLSCDAAGLSIKASVAEGKEHGVFLDGNGTNVSRFLHKQSEETLRKIGAVDEVNNVNIDTGCIWLGAAVVNRLLGIIMSDGKIDTVKFDRFVNDKVRLSFYADIVFPLSADCTLEEYFKEIPEGSFSPELHACRQEIWDAVHGFKMKLIKMMPAKYIHFGTTHELFNLMVWDIEDYAYLGWQQKILTNISDGGALSNVLISGSSSVSKNSYIEDCVLENVTVPDNAIVAGVNIKNTAVPAGCVIHGLKLINGKFVCRIYGIKDNPKNSIEGKFLRSSIAKIKKYAGIENSELWDGRLPSIWTAKVYAQCDTMEEAIDMALVLYRISANEASAEEIEAWKSAKRYSLQESFNMADTKAILDWQEHISHLVRAKCAVQQIKSGEYSLEAIEKLKESEDISKEIKYLLASARSEEFPHNMRLFLAVSDACKKYGLTFDGKDYMYYEDCAYEIIRNYILEAVNKEHAVPGDIKIVKDRIKEECPVRVNFCGSPSDAAPYCLERGGTMLDGTILLNGKKPIKIEAMRIDKPCIELISADLDSGYEFFDLDEVRSCNNPYDTFALHKAVLVASGVLNGAGTMEELCKKIGGGIRLMTDVDIPKGSGLGTSSILAAGCLKAVNEMFGLDTSARCIYAQVFAVEQLMSTGGGWQDQVGGFTPGIKFFRSQPGAYQDISVDYIDMTEETKKELQDRFVLIFSGQRRLARNVLREEMNQCIRNTPDTLEAMEDIRRCCALMKYELERGNVTEFAKYITKQFELVKTIDSGASNTCIEYIFDICSDLIDGKSICGAGGGGFLMAVLKEGVSRDLLKNRIKKEFMDCGIEVWDSTFIY